jgi:hypothetical protein
VFKNYIYCASINLWFSHLLCFFHSFVSSFSTLTSSPLLHLLPALPCFSPSSNFWLLFVLLCVCFLFHPSPVLLYTLFHIRVYTIYQADLEEARLELTITMSSVRQQLAAVWEFCFKKFFVTHNIHLHKYETKSLLDSAVNLFFCPPPSKYFGAQGHEFFFCHMFSFMCVSCLF